MNLAPFLKRPVHAPVDMTALERKRLIECGNDDIREQAKRIIHIQNRLKSFIAADSQMEEAVLMDLVHQELTSAEVVFFIMYNQLRILFDLEPLKGTRFTGEYNYAAHVRT